MKCLFRMHSMWQVSARLENDWHPRQNKNCDSGMLLVACPLNHSIRNVVLPWCHRFEVMLKNTSLSCKNKVVLMQFLPHVRSEKHKIPTQRCSKRSDAMFCCESAHCDVLFIFPVVRHCRAGTAASDAGYPEEKWGRVSCALIF